MESQRCCRSNCLADFLLKLKIERIPKNFSLFNRNYMNSYSRTLPRQLSGRKKSESRDLISKGIRVRNVIPQATSVAVSTLVHDGLVEDLKV